MKNMRHAPRSHDNHRHNKNAHGKRIQVLVLLFKRSKDVQNLGCVHRSRYLSSILSDLRTQIIFFCILCYFQLQQHRKKDKAQGGVTMEIPRSLPKSYRDGTSY